MHCLPSRWLPILTLLLISCGETRPRSSNPGSGSDAGPSIADAGTVVADGGAPPMMDAGAPPVGPQWQTLQVMPGLDIKNILGSGPEDVFVYGYDASDVAHLFHYDGATFSEISFPGSRCDREFGPVAIDGPGRLVALNTSCENLMRYGPSGWTSDDPLPNGFRNARAVYASPNGRVFLAGLSPNLWEIPAPGAAVVEHNNPARSLSPLSVLGGTPDDVVWGGAGAQGGITYLDTEGWHPPEQGDLHFGTRADRIIGFAADDVWFLARGLGNVVCRIHDGARDCYEIPTSSNRRELGGLIVVAPGVAYTTFGRAAEDSEPDAERGSLHWLVGGRWYHLQAPATLGDLGPAFAAAPDDLWFAGEDGQVLRYAAALPDATVVEIVESGPPGPGPGLEPSYLGGINAASVPLRFCSSAGGTLVPSLPPGAHFGYVPVAIPEGGSEVLQFGVWVEPIDEPNVCRFSGVNRNRKTVFLNAGAVRTLVGYLDAAGEDQVEVQIDSLRAPAPGQGQIRVVNASLDRVDVCAAGSVIDADVARAASSAFHEVAAGTVVLDVHDAATPACSGAQRATFEVTVAAGESLSAIAHPTAPGTCLVAVNDGPSTPVTCGR